MAISFSSFTTIFFFLVTLIGMGIIFEKQFLALEDKLDAWISSKRNDTKKEVATSRERRRSGTYNQKPTKDDSSRKFAA